MNLKKAIEIGSDSYKRDTILLTPDDKDALKLLIEAGKRILYTREANITMNWKELPGETED